MKTAKIIFVTILLVFLLIPISLLAEDQEEQDTNFRTEIFQVSMMNGKAWIKLDHQSKITYLVGLENGATLLIAEMDSVKNEKKNALAAYPALERLMVGGFRFSDIVEEVNHFYDQASNRRIPVVDAYRYVLKKFKGASPEELAADQSALRKKYNQ